MRGRSWGCQTAALRKYICLTVGVLETTINQLITTYSQVVYQSALDHSITSGSSISNSCWCKLMGTLLSSSSRPWRPCRVTIRNGNMYDLTDLTLWQNCSVLSRVYIGHMQPRYTLYPLLSYRRFTSSQSPFTCTCIGVQYGRPETCIHLCPRIEHWSTQSRCSQFAFATCSAKLIATA